MRTSRLLVGLTCTALAIVAFIDAFRAVREITGLWIIVLVLLRAFEPIAIVVRLATGPYWYAVATLALMLALAARSFRRRRG